MWRFSLELGEARVACVLDQVGTGFQGLFIISVCMLLFNEKHSNVHAFFLTFVNMHITRGSPTGRTFILLHNISR